MLETNRLRLRQWCDADLQPFADLNSDPQVMRYYPSVYEKSRSDALLLSNKSQIERAGWGLWAAELRSCGEFIGYIGLSPCNDQLPFAPAIEIGWRLASHCWRQGFATEGANQVLRYAFTKLGMETIVSITSVPNIPSQRVMQKIGLRNTGNNFNHPALPLTHPLSEHVFYKTDRVEWLQRS